MNDHERGAGAGGALEAGPGRPPALDPALPSRRAALALAAGVALFFLVFFYPRLRYDALHYYEAPRSVVFDADLNGANERLGYTEPLWNPGVELNRGRIAKFYVYPDFTRRGYRFPFSPIGFPLLLLPPAAAAHLAVLAARMAGAPLAATGYSLVYRLAVSFWTVLAGAFAAGLTLRLARRFFGPAAALAGCLFVLLGTNLPAYLFVDPVLSHGVDFFLITLFLVLWLRFRESGEAAGPLALGLLGGFTTVFRYQNVFLLGIPILDAVIDGLTGADGQAGGRRARRRASLRALALLGLGVAIAALPQLAYWKVMHGVWLPGPETTGTSGMPSFRPFDPQLGLMLMSSRNGLINWTPLVAPALVGIPLVLRRHRRLGFHLIWLMAIQIYHDSCRTEWWNLGFGVRRTAGYALPLALGMAALLEASGRVRGLRPLLIAAGALLVIWNAFFLTQYYLGENLYEWGSLFYAIAGGWNPHGFPSYRLARPPWGDLATLAREAAGFVRWRALAGFLPVAALERAGAAGLAGALLALAVLAWTVVEAVLVGARRRGPRRLRAATLAGAAALAASAAGILALDALARPVLRLPVGGGPAQILRLGPRAALPAEEKPRALGLEPYAAELPVGVSGPLEAAIEPVDPEAGGYLRARFTPGGQTVEWPLATLVPGAGLPGERIDESPPETGGRAVRFELAVPPGATAVELTADDPGAWLWAIGVR